MKTFMASPATIDRKWYVVDAEGMTLGRLASEVAKVLRGKNKPIFTPHIDTGDYVIVVNAEKIKVTGKKLNQKVYYSHSEYVGGMKETTLKEMLAKHPERVIEYAVKAESVCITNGCSPCSTSKYPSPSSRTLRFFRLKLSE